MTVNVGSIDRVLRFLLGAVLILLPMVTTLELWANPVARFGVPVVGAVLVITALVRFCPLARIFGLRTCARS